MSDPKGQAATGAMEASKETMREAYETGMGGLLQREKGVNQGLAMEGEPGYVKAAYGDQRAAIGEAMLTAGGQRQRAADSAFGRMNQGGNYSNVLNPQDIGAQIADQMYSSRTHEAIGKIDETNNLMQMALGLSGQAASGQMGAAQNQLGAISLMPGYNKGYATALGFADIAGSVYGGGQQAGWWGQPGLVGNPGGTPPQPAPSTGGGGGPLW